MEFFSTFKKIKFGQESINFEEHRERNKLSQND